MSGVASFIARCGAFRFTLRVKLLLSFAILCGLFLLFGQTSRAIFYSNSLSMDKVLAINKAVKLADDAKLNLTRAGQLPKTIQVSTSGLDEIKAQADTLHESFRSISAQLERQAVDEQSKRMAKEIAAIGSEFYDAIDAFLPIRKKMLSYTADYQGRNRPLPDIITERELGHIHFIRTIKESIEGKKRITGGLDTAGCTFYQWYSQTKFGDEDIAEVFEEIHPLHDKLHKYARQIDDKIAAEDFDGAREIFASAEKDLKTLGLYFSGLRKLVEEKYKTQEDAFTKQLVKVDEVYQRAGNGATALQRYLNDTVLRDSLASMESVTAASKKRIAVIAFLGLGLSVVIALYAALMMGSFVRVLDQMGRRLGESAALFLTMSEQLSTNADLTQTMAAEANHNVDKTSDNISSLAASSEEINAAIYEISSNSVQSAGIAKQATEEAARAAAVVGGLKKYADTIGDVTKTISDIAFKTKLLALNANVESARAGEAGAGFAVVADEVKNLAQAAEGAAREISQKISTMQIETKKTAEVMTNIGGIVAKINDNSSAIAASVEEESAVVSEISNRVNGVAGLTQEVATRIHEVSAAANDTKEQSLALQDQAAMLESEAGELAAILRKL